MPAISTWAGSREALAFPEFYARKMQPQSEKTSDLMVCIGLVSYKGLELVQRDLANLRAAVTEAKAHEAFVPAVSPLDIAGAQKNEFYKTEEEFLSALADVMRVEYRAIIDAGFLLQIDSLRLTNYYIKNPDITVQEFRSWAER